MRFSDERFHSIENTIKWFSKHLHRELWNRSNRIWESNLPFSSCFNIELFGIMLVSYSNTTTLRHFLVESIGNEVCFLNNLINNMITLKKRNFKLVGLSTVLVNISSIEPIMDLFKRVRIDLNILVECLDQSFSKMLWFKSILLCD